MFQNSKDAVRIIMQYLYSLHTDRRGARVFGEGWQNASILDRQSWKSFSVGGGGGRGIQHIFFQPEKVVAKFS